MTGPGLVVMVVAVIIVPVWLIASARAPVDPNRVARFARRQHLKITPGNGNQVIRYLATTRRWRVAGLITAYGIWLVGLIWGALGLTDDPSVDFNLLYLLAAWFVGAVIAEARLATRPAGTRRSASLLPREPAAYLSRSARLAMPVAFTASLVVAALTLLMAAAGTSVDARAAVVGLAAALLVATIVWAVQRRVLGRPQPADLQQDQLAADDAIRSRSLHVLAGAGFALVLYALGYQLDALVTDPPGNAAFGVLMLFRILLIVLAPLLGWMIATTAWEVRRPAAQLA